MLKIVLYGHETIKNRHYLILFNLYSCSNCLTFIEHYKRFRRKFMIIQGVEEPSQDAKRDEEWVKNLNKELRVKINMKRVTKIIYRL